MGDQIDVPKDEAEALRNNAMAKSLETTKKKVSKKTDD